MVMVTSMDVLRHCRGDDDDDMLKTAKLGFAVSASRHSVYRLGGVTTTCLNPGRAGQAVALSFVISKVVLLYLCMVFLEVSAGRPPLPLA